LANSCVKNHTDNFNQLKQSIQKKETINFDANMEGDRNRRIAKLYATTQGYFDLFTENKNLVV